MTAVLLCALALDAWPQSTGPFPAGAVDSRTIRVQQKVEELYERGDYERALFIYKNELAPLGDKYAQYMVGYMYLTGAGVDEDPVQASAWYRLAAERENPEFIAVRDQLLTSLDDVHTGRSDQLYLQLRQRYSDMVILARLIREDIESLVARTGSRIPGGGGQTMIVDPRTGFGISGEDFERRIRSRIDARLEFVTRTLGLRGSEWSIDNVDLDELDRRVLAAASTIDDRSPASQTGIADNDP